MNIGRVILNAVFPLSCVACKNDPLPHILLCSSCHQTTKIHYGIRNIGEINPLQIFWVYEFGGAARSLIHHLKFKNKDYLSNYMARIMCRHPHIPWGELNAVVPIPHTWRTWLKRGYNQSELLAQNVSQLTNLPVVRSVIKRKEWSGSQIGMKRRTRLINAQKNFSLQNTASLKNLERVILIDDVVTTGATLLQCSSLLQKGGVKKVYALCFSNDD